MAANVDPASSPSRTSTSRLDIQNSDLDPAAFLKTVRELSEKREREDAERYRKLEEEVEKSRAARAARRQERARSISPEKANAAQDSHALRPPTDLRASIRSTPSPMTPPASSSASEMGGPSMAGPPSPTKDIPEFRGFGSAKKSSAPATASPTQTTESSPQGQQSASSLARSGTLSWQRRPASRGAGSRPQSAFATEIDSPSRTEPKEEQEPSRDQIAASLSSRDPSWFKQTADRGIGSAAYRKSKDEAAIGESVVSGRRGLPGISREVSLEPEKQASPVPSESLRSEPTSRPSSVRDSDFSISGFSTVRSTPMGSKPDLKSLIAADAPQHEASPMSDCSSSLGGDRPAPGRPLTMSSSQARLENAGLERPSSPTKGAGGFVQSAMMRRSDSVNKRWSAQPGSSLSRQNSLAGQRSGYGGLQSSHSMPKLEPTSDSRESSHEPKSRPTSSSNLPALAGAADASTQDIFVKPALPHHSRSKSVVSNYSANTEDGAVESNNPPKRWSPTKSSWIESALTRPESPKPSGFKNTQPSWMVDIAKAKAQRASAESTPRTGTPAPAEDVVARPSSPTKAPFSQGTLKSSESRALQDTSKSPVSVAREEAVSAGTPVPALNIQNVPAAVKPAHDDGKNSGDTAYRKMQPERDHQPDASSRRKPHPDEEPAEPASAIEDAPRGPLKHQAPAKSKPETPPTPPVDFRSTLRSRPPPELKEQETPEFLSKFGNLRKTTTEKYVPPDVLKDNILRGKTDLAKSGGPIKTARKDELKESLLAKKDEWKKAKEDGTDLPGQVHTRKASGAPATPSKPEALAQKELLGRSESLKTAASSQKAREATPEALARHRSLKQKPAVQPPHKQTSVSEPNKPRMEHLSKQTSAPAEMEHKASSHTETSRLAARFNPGLANVLARGPSAMTNRSNAPSNSETPVIPERSSAATPGPSEPVADGEPLQDMRKGRAKGPKKRKGGVADTSSLPVESRPEPDAKVPEHADEKPAAQSAPVFEEKVQQQAPGSTLAKPRAPPGSAASVMMASLRETTGSKSDAKQDRPATPARSPVIRAMKPQNDRLATPSKTASAFSKPETSAQIPASALGLAQKTEVPEFAGFNSLEKSTTSQQPDDNKENADMGVPFVKSAASFWSRQAPPKSAETPLQIQLPSKKDEEAALRSAGLLASSPARPASSNGLGISVEKTNGAVSTPPASAVLPPKPAKSSKVLSGQLQEASPNQGALTSGNEPETEAERWLSATFGTAPVSGQPLMIDIRATLTEPVTEPTGLKTLKKSIMEISEDGSTRVLSQREEYTLFDEAVYVCTETYALGAGTKRSRVFLWTGESASAAAVEHAQATAKKFSRESGSAPIQQLRQGLEMPTFLQAVGGILVTRRGAREGAPKQYMLQGRKHQGQIVFDEVEWGVGSLCAGFVYLISYPVTLQESKMYLWKGSASSTEEIGAARLAAMDLSETGEVIEVDQGAEFPSFLKIFRAGTTKTSILKMTGFWETKANATDFQIRLFRIQQAESKPSFLSSVFGRRPSWNNRSPSRSPARDDFRIEAIEITPFRQSDLEAEGVYVLDAYSELYVLLGPLFAVQVENARNALLVQALLFAKEYSALVVEDRPAIPSAYVLFSGCLEHVKTLFRHWDESRGLWGTESLMAGLAVEARDTVKVLPLQDVLRAVYRS